jgi:hypothetical protein
MSRSLPVLRTGVRSVRIRLRWLRRETSRDFLSEGELGSGPWKLRCCWTSSVASPLGSSPFAPVPTPAQVVAPHVTGIFCCSSSVAHPQFGSDYNHCISRAGRGLAAALDGEAASQLAAHLRAGGAPVMIGGEGGGARAIIGVRLFSGKTEVESLLVLDPHYSGHSRASLRPSAARMPAPPMCLWATYCEDIRG